MASTLKWFGAKANAYILSQLAKAMYAAGSAWVAEARERAPVRSGQLRDAIGFVYDASRKKLTLYCDVPWAYFQEYGTRFIPAHPFMRPALQAIPRLLRRLTTLQAANVDPKYQERTRSYAKKTNPNINVEVGKGSFE